MLNIWDNNVAWVVWGGPIRFLVAFDELDFLLSWLKLLWMDLAFETMVDSKFNFPMLMYVLYHVRFTRVGGETVTINYCHCLLCDKKKIVLIWISFSRKFISIIIKSGKKIIIIVSQNWGFERLCINKHANKLMRKS